ncbi:MAG: hypothetical protein VB934_16795 [Polyangiaceae bacterium]
MTTPYLRFAPLLAGGLTLLACGSAEGPPSDSNRGESIDYASRIAVEWTPAPTTLACPYPNTSQPGATEGATVPSHLAWQGFDIQSSVPGNVPVTNFFDCDGSKGFHALIFDTSQTQ